MGILAWLIVYVVVFGLLQLALYRYVQRDDPSPETTPAPIKGAPPVAFETPTEAGNGIHCQECGADNQNDSIFVYCCECATRLR